jgi:hypothetical protein
MKGWVPGVPSGTHRTRIVTAGAGIGIGPNVPSSSGPPLAPNGVCARGRGTLSGPMAIPRVRTRPVAFEARRYAPR